MKKLISLTFALLLTVGLLAGCGGTEKVNLEILETEYITEDYALCFSKENTTLRDAVDMALTELKEEGVLDAIVAKYIEGVDHDMLFQQDVAEDAPVLVMATNATFPPYEFYENNEIVGIDAEIMQAVCDKLGAKLEISDMEFNSIIAAVQTGAADVGAAGMTVTEERKENVDFSQSYATGVQVVIVPEGSPITTVDDLFVEGANYTIGVQESTTGDIYSTGDIEEAGLGTIKRYNKGTEAVQALITGQVDCVIIDNEPAKSYVEANNA